MFIIGLEIAFHGNRQSSLSLLFPVGNPAFPPILSNLLPIIDRLLFQALSTPEINLVFQSIHVFLCLLHKG
jgi:hypothetical protein